MKVGGVTLLLLLLLLLVVVALGVLRGAVWQGHRGGWECSQEGRGK